MPKRLALSSSLVLLVAASLPNAASSQQPKQQKPLQPLGDVLHLVFDSNKDQKVTIDEMNTQLGTIGALFQNFDDDAQAEEYERQFLAVKAASPKIFELLDSNGDKTLSKSELKYMTKLETSLKKGGGMRDLLRDVFSLLDTDGDDQLSADELLAGCKSDDVISKATVEFHKLFPLRKNAQELEYFVKDTIESIGGTASLNKESIAEGMKWIDDDKDGFIQRKEVGKYYNIAGKKFLEISKTVKQMGPMMALFGGMDMNGGGGGGGGGFKMDL